MFAFQSWKKSMKKLKNRATPIHGWKSRVF